MTLDAAEESQLIQAALAGSNEAFSDLFHRYYPMIHAFAYRLSLNATDAEEIAQDTFIKAARSLAAFRGGSFNGWLYRIARNVTMDRCRSRERESRLADAVCTSLQVASTSREADFEPVAVALRSLPEHLREAIVLTTCEEMTHGEAAAVLGCAEATVSWRVFQAKRKLRKLLGGERA